jgi:predicted enzyme related to lactoylglutathione lyase
MLTKGVTMTDIAAPTLNTVTWWEIPVLDLEQAKTFYGAVFGWTFQPFGDGYAGIVADGAMIGGLSESGAEGIGEGVRIYVNVADLESVLTAVEANGGSTRTPRTEVGGDMGWWAHFTDPQGRVIGLCTDNAAG